MLKQDLNLILENANNKIVKLKSYDNSCFGSLSTPPADNRI